MISNALIKFLSSKINLILMTSLGYVLVLSLMHIHNVPLLTIAFIIIIIGVIQLLAHIIGVSRGMVLAHTYEKDFNKLINMIKKHEKKKRD